MRERIIKKTAGEYRVTKWSGGLTTELAIAPPEAVYADRKFLWRISSATVELERSEFTPLPDYQRLLMILDGTLRIAHDGGDWKTLPAFQVHRFDGASDTVSEGKVIDFNLMLRKGQCEGALVPISWKEGGERRFLETADELLLYCFRGTMKVLPGKESAEREWEIQSGESLLLSGDACRAQWTVKSDAPLLAVAAVVRDL